MKFEELKKEIEIPEGVEAEIQGSELIAKGPKGENKKSFLHSSIKISKAENKIVLTAKNATKNEKTMMGTFSAHAKNILLGVKDGFDYKLKICSGHFPITIKVEEEKVVINNFMGEKFPRKARVLQDVKVKIENDTILVSGHDKERVSQSAANIEIATKRSGFDKRIFQDGCYIIEKSGRRIA